MKRMSFSNPNKLTFDEVIKDWQSKGIKGDVFDGHFLISFVTSNNQLENINIDYNSTRELFESEHITSYTGDLRDVFSVLNNRKVAQYLNQCLKEQKLVDTDMILEVHRLLMFGSMDRHRYEDNGERAGTFKVKDYCVGKYSVGYPPEDVKDGIEELCSFCKENGEASPIKLASVFQCYFEYIHPFADGNGRVGRWLTNYILVKGKYPPILFSTEDKNAYYKALESFDELEDCTPMSNYIKSQIITSYIALREF